MAPRSRQAMSATTHSCRFSLRMAKRSRFEMPHERRILTTLETLAANCSEEIGSQPVSIFRSTNCDRWRPAMAKKMSLRVRRLIATRVQNCTAFCGWKQSEVVQFEPVPSWTVWHTTFANAAPSSQDVRHPGTGFGGAPGRMPETRRRSVRGRSPRVVRPHLRRYSLSEKRYLHFDQQGAGEQWP